MRHSLGDQCDPVLGIFGAFNVSLSRHIACRLLYTWHLVMLNASAMMVHRNIGSHEKHLGYQCGQEIGHIIPRDRVSSEDFFPHFHVHELELERELQYVHATDHVGVGAFVCQGLEARGHHKGGLSLHVLDSMFMKSMHFFDVVLMLLC